MVDDDRVKFWLNIGLAIVAVALVVGFVYMFSVWATDGG